MERDGRVKVEVVKDVTSESLLKLAINKEWKGIFKVFEDLLVDA